MTPILVGRLYTNLVYVRLIRAAMCWLQYYTYRSCGGGKKYGGLFKCYKCDCTGNRERNQDLRQYCSDCNACKDRKREGSIEDHDPSKLDLLKETRGMRKES